MLLFQWFLRDTFWWLQKLALLIVCFVSPTSTPAWFSFGFTPNRNNKQNLSNLKLAKTWILYFQLYVQILGVLSTVLDGEPKGTLSIRGWRLCMKLTIICSLRSVSNQMNQKRNNKSRGVMIKLGMCFKRTRAKEREHLLNNCSRS